jgi:hypothetical protein
MSEKSEIKENEELRVEGNKIVYLGPYKNSDITFNR